MELRTWLVSTYNDDEDEEEQEGVRYDKVKMCFACKEIITVVWIDPFSFPSAYLRHIPCEFYPSPNLGALRLRISGLGNPMLMMCQL